MGLHACSRPLPGGNQPLQDYYEPGLMVFFFRVVLSFSPSVQVQAFFLLSDPFPASTPWPFTLERYLSKRVQQQFFVCIQVPRERRWQNWARGVPLYSLP